MIIGVPRETAPGEKRVAIVPDVISRLIKSGHRVLVEKEAGLSAQILDQTMADAGAEIITSRNELLKQVDVVFSMRSLADSDLSALQNATIAIAMLQPLTIEPEYIDALNNRAITTFSMDSIPRISRAQSMDVLSSMATIAGYRAAILASYHLGKFYPLLMTAAGTVTPAKILILGAGVAGLQAIATAHRLGAMVQAFDTRPVVREQVESLGASFLSLSIESQQNNDGYAQALAEDTHRQELELLAKPVSEADVVITTAQIPGRRAPVLVTKEMVASMRPGAVIIDLAGETGGNCEASVAGEVVQYHGVTVEAPLNVPSQLALPASQLYARNLFNFFQHAVAQGLAVTENPRAISLQFEDEIVKRTCVTHGGTTYNEAVLARMEKIRS